MRRGVAVLAAALMLLGGCSWGSDEEPAPEPSPDLTSHPKAVAVNPGPYEAGPFEPPAKGAYVGAWIKPDELTHVGRIAAVGGLEESLVRKLDFINTYRLLVQ